MPKALDRTLYKATNYLAETVATSLGNVIEQLPVVVFAFHQQKDRAGKSKAGMNTIEEKHKLKEEIEQMQKRIAKEEKDDQEAAANGKLPKKMKDQIAKEAKAQAKVYIAEFKKKERVKYLGR